MSDRMAKGGERLLVTGEDFERINGAAKKTESEPAGWAELLVRALGSIVRS